MKSAKKIFIRNNNGFIESKFKNKTQINIFNSLSLPNIHFKEEILFSNKTQKELLISHIKDAQIKIISKKKKNNNNLNNINIFKNILIELKQNLLDILKEKQKKEKYLQNKLNKIKKMLQINIFKKEKVEKCFGRDEISKLKILNFEIENEIKKIDFLSQNKKDLNKYLKIVDIFPEHNRELFYNFIKQDNNDIEQILNTNISKEKEMLIETKNKYDLQNFIIEQLQNEINILKYNIELKKNYNVSNIIFEESLENKIITSINNYYDKNKNNNFNDCNNNDNDYDNDMNKDYYDIKDNKNKNKIDINNNNNNNNNNNINNILNFNMNINLNINTNKYFSKSDYYKSLKYS